MAKKRKRINWDSRKRNQRSEMTEAELFALDETARIINEISLWMSTLDPREPSFTISNEMIGNIAKIQQTLVVILANAHPELFEIQPLRDDSTN